MSSENKIVRSDYYYKLETPAKKRYEVKLIQLELENDPYTLENTDYDLTRDIRGWPDIVYADIFVYLINYPSMYTKTSLKAYKSLESYKYVQSGLVDEVKVKKLKGDTLLVHGLVRHGQSMFTKKQNQAWIGIQKSGDIINAHCTCMAGLGETCSHVGALMFYLLFTMDYYKRHFTDSITSDPNGWLPPKINNVEFALLCDIDFRDKSKDDKKRGNADDDDEPPTKVKKSIPRLSDVDKDNFYFCLSKANPNSAILRLIEGYNDRFVPAAKKLERVLFKFYDEKYEEMLYHELLQHCLIKFMSIEISQDEVDQIETHTRLQSKSSLWFQARAGVVTGSRFKLCCQTDISQPAKSTIIKICYPVKKKFEKPAIEHGITNEPKAIESLKTILSKHHNDVEIIDCGLFRSTEFPFLGASPDGIMKCSCCNDSTRYAVEVKCPFKLEEKSMKDLAKKDPEFCLQSDKKNALSLKRNHPYYYQIQLEMLMAGAEYCYFYVYGKSESFYELVPIDLDFLSEKIEIAKRFFVFAVLPELLGKWYSKSHITEPKIYHKDSDTNNDICTCQQQRDSETILCADKTCVVKNYHLQCLGLEEKPKRKWFCPYCRRKKSRSRKK